jgi:hypothetical protein
MNRSLLALATLSLLTAAHGCIGTPGRPIVATLELSLIDVEIPTRTGWSVEVDEAALSVSAVRARDASIAVAWLEPLLLPRAFAHGGHGESDSTVLASWVGSEVLVLGGSLPIQLLEGRAGITDRGSLVLGGVLDASSPDAERLHGLPLYVAGTARRGEDTVRFAGGITLPEAESERLVEGIAMAGEIDDGAVLQLELDLGVWFDAVHFDRLAVGEDGVAPITDDTQAAIALRLGLGDLRSYVATVTPAPTR